MVEREEELALRLRTEQEEQLAKPSRGGSFFEYRLLVTAKIKKLNRLDGFLAYTFPKARLCLLVIYNREVLPKVNRALQQKYAGHTFISNGYNSIIKVPGRLKGSSRATF